MARYLIVAHQTSGSRQLLDHTVKTIREDDAAEFTLLVPAAPPSYWRAWDDVQARDQAYETADLARMRLEDAGARVTRSAVGAREPLAAIEDELREHGPYDAIVVCTLPVGISRWLRMDLVNRARQRTGLPVTHVLAEASAPERAREPVLAGVGAAEGRREAPPASTARAGNGSSGLAGMTRAESDAADEASRAGVSVVSEFGGAPLLEVMGRNPAALRGYLGMLDSLWDESGIDPQLRELVMLRTAQLLHSNYAWHEHVGVARSIGIPDVRIAALEHWRSSEHVHFDDRERAVLGYTDAIAGGLHGLHVAHAILARSLSESEVVAITLLVGFAAMTASFAAAMEIAPEGPFVGWQLY